MGKRARRPNPIHDPLYEGLREELRRMRKEAGLTQAELGGAFLRPHTFVNKVEAGDRRVDPIEFCRWCLACGADPAEVMGRLAKRVRKSKPHS